MGRRGARPPRSLRRQPARLDDGRGEPPRPTRNAGRDGCRRNDRRRLAVEGPPLSQESPPAKPPIFFVCGAFAAGKSTAAALVAVALPECFVLDVDWLLAPLLDLA